MRASFLIGDKDSDLAAAAAAGIPGICSPAAISPPSPKRCCDSNAHRFKVPLAAPGDMIGAGAAGRGGGAPRNGSI